MALNLADYRKIEIPDNNYRALEYIELVDKFFDLGTGWTFTQCYEVDANMNVTAGYSSYIFGYSYNTGTSGTIAIGAKFAYMNVNSSREPHVSLGKKETSNSYIGSVTLTSISGSIDEKRCLYRMYVNGNGINMDVEDSSGTLLNTGSDTYSSDDIGLPRAGLCAIYSYSTDYSRYIWRSGFSGKLYSFKVRSSKGGQLLQEWVPAQRKTDNKNGLYNTLTGEFMLPYTYNRDTDTMTQVSATAGPITEEHPSWVQQWEVATIKDSNNNIIWGSYSKFPYRRLEYIHFNGTDNYINTGLTDNATKYRAITFSLDSDETPSSDIYILGSRDTSVDATKQRYWLPRLDGNGIRFVVGSTWTSNGAYPVATYLPANTKRVIYGKTSTSSNNMKLEFGINDASGNTLTSGNITGGAVSGFNSRTLALMATNDGSGSTGMTPKGYCAGKVYNLIERATSASGNINHNFIPCQRKSDGKYGMYDVVAETFKPLEGTADSYTGGPLVDEYWNLTI